MKINPGAFSDTYSQPRLYAEWSRLMQGYYPCTFLKSMYDITHAHKRTDKMQWPAGFVLRIQDEVVDLSLMQVSLVALTCCIHLTWHAKAAGIGAAQAAGRKTLIQLDRQEWRTDFMFSARTPSSTPHCWQLWEHTSPLTQISSNLININLKESTQVRV